jgi:hypothetical protein
VAKPRPEKKRQKAKARYQVLAIFERSMIEDRNEGRWFNGLRLSTMHQFDYALSDTLEIGRPRGIDPIGYTPRSPAAPRRN